MIVDKATLTYRQRPLTRAPRVTDEPCGISKYRLLKLHVADDPVAIQLLRREDSTLQWCLAGPVHRAECHRVILTCESYFVSRRRVHSSWTDCHSNTSQLVETFFQSL